MGKSLHIGSAAITRSMDVALSENLGFFLSGSAPAPTPTPGGAPRGCHRLARRQPQPGPWILEDVRAA